MADDLEPDDRDDESLEEMKLTLETDVRRELDCIQHDLGVVCQHYQPIVGAAVVSAALIETAGTLAARLVQDRPGMRAPILERLRLLTLYIETAGGRPQ